MQGKRTGVLSILGTRYRKILGGGSENRREVNSGETPCTAINLFLTIMNVESITPASSTARGSET